MIQALLVAVCLAVFPYQGSSIMLESGNVNNYEVVYPQKVTAFSKGGVQNAQPATKYEDRMQYEFQLNGEPVVLHLERNKGLFSADYTETHYSPDGREITTSPPIQDHCYYHGYTENKAESTAVISACEGLKGHFKHQGETYLIEPLRFSNSEAHAVYKDEHIEKEDETPKICGATQSTWKSDGPIEKDSNRSLVMTLQQERYLQARKYIEFFVVVDNRMCRKYNHNLTTIRTRVYECVNIINMMYRSMNFHIALTGLEIWSNKDKINVQPAVYVTLDLFGEWRRMDLLPRKRNDNAQLLTGIDFDGTTLGLGYVGTLCTPKHSTAIVQDYNRKASLVASAMAHELGHNLGMHHDTDSCNCNGNPCTMAPIIGTEPFNEFSTCSVQEHRRYLIRSSPQCVLNKPLSTDIVAPAVCGNDFVEVGEECDCGSPQDCQSACCNATTCKLHHGAQCDTGECCEQCKIKGAGQVCRAAKDDCDLPERCNGRSAECPRDRFKRDGHPCQNNQGYCYHGTCPTLANQCIKLFGPGKVVAMDRCFERNLLGNCYGYCRRENGVNSPCEPQDVKCGRLYCTEGNMNSCILRFYQDDPDNGMVEPGTKCGDGRVCRNRQCVDM